MKTILTLFISSVLFISAVCAQDKPLSAERPSNLDVIEPGPGEILGVGGVRYRNFKEYITEILKRDPNLKCGWCKRPYLQCPACTKENTTKADRADCQKLADIEYKKWFTSKEGRKFRRDEVQKIADKYKVKVIIVDPEE